MVYVNTVSGIVRASSTAAKEIDEATEVSLEGCLWAVYKRRRD
jgi:hypothetical protein